MPLIHPRESAIDVTRGAPEIERDRHPGCCDHASIHGVARFAEPFEQYVPAERDARKQERRADIGGPESPRDRIDVASVAGMVESWRAIGFTAATAKEQHVSRPSATGGLEKQATRVMRPCRSLESMQYHKVRPAWRSIEANQVEEVPVIRVPSLDPCL